MADMELFLVDADGDQTTRPELAARVEIVFTAATGEPRMLAFEPAALDRSISR